MPITAAEIALIEQAFDLPPRTDGVNPAADALEAQGWEVWLRTLAPNTFTAPFSKEHTEFWTLFWDITHKLKRGEDLSDTERDIILALARGYGKSTQAEMSAIMHGCIVGKGVALYLSDTQTLAEEHLYSIKAILESPAFAYYYPAMSRPKMSGSGGGTAKYTQDTIICENGFAITARGSNASVRGGRVGVDRFTLVIIDDLDNLTDSLMVIEKKKRIVSRTILPAMAKNGITILAQNLVTENSVAAQIVHRKTDILSKRTVIGGGAIKAFQELELKQETLPDGRIEWHIAHCVPTWEYFNLNDARAFLAHSGRDAFLAEYQHEFDSKTGKVIPNYNEEAQIITWSMFEKVFKDRFIPSHWKAAVGLDVGYSDGMRPHYSTWCFVAVAAANSAMPGVHFVYRGMDFTKTSIDDQADMVKSVLRVGVEKDETDSVAGGLIKDWQLSHERTGEMMTLNQKHKLPFRKFDHWKSEDGIAQWNHLSISDHSKPNPFKDDEEMDGEYLIGCPSLFYIVDDDQLTQPRDHRGLKLLREQVSSWEYVPTKINEAGLTAEKPSKINDDYGDCLKAIFKFFGQRPTPLTLDERVQRVLDERLSPMKDVPQEIRAEAMTTRILAYGQEKQKMEEQIAPVNPIGKMW
ncbi:MAG: hypothetical protein KF855_03360 [Acidobacteria bacterium]|nr:hypothetical protein [Acidobacteriota bacterium]